MYHVKYSSNHTAAAAAYTRVLLTTFRHVLKRNAQLSLLPAGAAVYVGKGFTR
jgi:hypothetical protein